MESVDITQKGVSTFCNDINKAIMNLVGNLPDDEKSNIVIVDFSNGALLKLIDNRDELYPTETYISHYRKAPSWSKCSPPLTVNEIKADFEKRNMPIGVFLAKMENGLIKSSPNYYLVSTQASLDVLEFIMSEFTAYKLDPSMEPPTEKGPTKTEELEIIGETNEP